MVVSTYPGVLLLLRQLMSSLWLVPCVIADHVMTVDVLTSVLLLLLQVVHVGRHGHVGLREPEVVGRPRGGGYVVAVQGRHAGSRADHVGSHVDQTCAHIGAFTSGTGIGIDIGTGIWAMEIGGLTRSAHWVWPWRASERRRLPTGEGEGLRGAMHD